MNETIIFELKKDHHLILILFRQISVESIFEERKKLFLNLKTLLEEHLQKEETFIYPVLLQSNNEEITAFGGQFLGSMRNYAVALGDVVDQIIQSTDPVNPTVMQNYEVARDRVKDRIFIEETSLFPVYEKIQL